MKRYDLEERTEKFSLDVLELCRNIKPDHITKPIINQLVRSATSIGANYCEANAASSKNDFRNKIYISKKEAQETCYWLRLLSKTSPGSNLQALDLEKKAHELVLIFGKIISSISASKLKH
jgi:four helix bundle protein